MVAVILGSHFLSDKTLISSPAAPLLLAISPMASSNKLKRLFEEVEKADEYILRQILRAVIIQSPLAVETTKRTLMTATLNQPLEQHPVDERVQPNTDNEESLAKNTKMKGGEATSLPKKSFCIKCRSWFDVPENERGIKRCVVHPGMYA